MRMILIRLSALMILKTHQVVLDETRVARLIMTSPGGWEKRILLNLQARDESIPTCVRELLVTEIATGNSYSGKNWASITRGDLQ